ncbi:MULTISPECIES: AbrB/MazE/SpoVT family DNA-binding domain-containing protein [Aerococcus]|uniref:AbrB/MazE/SpoVT family DNA-binding domain-containing protein n=1 Tax=Aerococcus sanguinicola TaxID=119206 RepID=A0A5N1GLC0_9LACT|nr:MULTISPECIES: AbrB/MazE/SpoVT family DNA-binding domain-containing protein [Aerococcus]KAA9301783.1 AbrB/MazE/SpoVT family DNA-binding domain-containing protein [Aerococcus sanguinicola]MDK6368799.1 AbrB/MazE/SpoVT family DNA-binding domain-containing protein [Aerococcus sp. UMB9870]MDK6679398.1 AbrB/MazE/SpoVT family DNA-binding domain-containing protein [Aerococcus sp. UMB8608]MDK6685759.1 AbrB/MazE/SpoVT family DNA-binding domain-containing protein [Aerococcus sp. UMB8623]MDK6939422.1 Ab
MMAKQVSAQVIACGDSQGISLNQRALELSHLQVGDRLDLEIHPDAILVTKKPSKRQERIRAFYQNGGVYEEGLVDYGETAGEEW